MTTEGSEADGIVIVHHPSDGADPYGVGPFPYDEKLITALITHKRCTCRVEALPVSFPAGITMAVVGVDVTSIIDLIKSLAGEEPNDRLN